MIATGTLGISNFLDSPVDAELFEDLLVNAIKYVIEASPDIYSLPNDSVMRDLLGREDLFKEIYRSGSLRCIRELGECTIHDFVNIHESIDPHDPK